MKGWKTIAFAGVTALVPILSMTETVTLVPPQYAPIYMLVVSALTAALRAVTSTPVGKG